ncbi:MAG TPA: hypothetical protein VFM15_05350 [Gammaproteobacteria bacterium]|nr:hypothetical protein [Gammaproteobacteria bacterium]
MKRLVFLGLLLLSLPLAGHAAATRTLEGDAATQGVTRLVLHAGVGEMKVTASPDDSVHVRVELEEKSRSFLWFFHWHSDATRQELEHISLKQQREGDSLSFRLDYPGDLDDDDVKQHWNVQVPARLAVGIDMKVGELKLSGVAGGVEASLNVGEIDVRTPRGPIKATINVGEIRARSATTQPGNIRLSTTIGDATLYQSGAGGQEQLRHSGLGREVSVSGTGPDSMDLESNIGEVSLRIEPVQSDAKKP